jgi:hypothetical protein
MEERAFIGPRRRKSVGWQIPRPTPRRVVEFAQAITGPDATEAIQTARLQKCRTGCGAYHKEGGAEYCKNCGCGKSRWAELKSKVKHERAKCPRQKWKE